MTSESERPLAEVYLGDGLYVSNDGYHITLRMHRLWGDEWMTLNLEVYESLVDYVENLRRETEDMEDR